MKKKTSNKLFNVALASTMAAGAVVAVAPSATEAATVTFKDLDKKNSHYNTVMNLVERGILKGYPDKTFKPGQEVSRAHAAVILAKVLGLDTKNVKDPKFKDVPKSHPYYGAIAALANAGIINGFGDGTYGPSKSLTRGQMAVIIDNSFDLEAGNATTPFKDIVNHPYKEQITALYANGVTTGKTATTFDAGSNVTRGQFASFVVRAEEATAAEKVVDIKDGQIITNKGTYAIEGDLAKVFNASNAAALKSAKIDFKFAEQTAALASLNVVAAAETVAKRIIGVASLTLVAGNATFDAGGYSIPEVTVNGNNVQVKNVVAEKLRIADNLTVNLTGVEAKQVVVSGTTKLTLDPSSKIEKLTLPEGKDIKDVITNYEQVKDQIKDVVVVDESGNETPVDPVTPAPGGGGGGIGGGSGSTDATDAKSTLDGLIEPLLTNTSGVWGTYGKKADSGYGFVFNAASKSKTLGEIKRSVENQGGDLEEGATSALDNLNSTQLGYLLKIDNVTVTSSPNGAAVDIVNNLSSSTLGELQDQIENILNPSFVAGKLSTLTGLSDTQAEGMFVYDFVEDYGDLEITFTFDDDSTLEYDYILSYE